MSNVLVRGLDSDTAVLLLDAAQKKGLEARVVRTTMHGFQVPEEIAKEAGVEYVSPEDDEPREVSGKTDLSVSGFDLEAGKRPEGEPAKKTAPAKKAAAKKTPAKKTAAKKTTAKKAAAKKTTTKK